MKQRMKTVNWRKGRKKTPGGARKGKEAQKECRGGKGATREHEM